MILQYIQPLENSEQEHSFCRFFHSTAHSPNENNKPVTEFLSGFSYAQSKFLTYKKFPIRAFLQISTNVFCTSPIVFQRVLQNPIKIVRNIGYSWSRWIGQLHRTSSELPIQFGIELWFSVKIRAKSRWYWCTVWPVALHFKKEDQFSNSTTIGNKYTSALILDSHA